MASKTIKVKATIFNPKRYKEGETVFHFGHKCIVEKGGFLVCDMDEDLAKIEVETGRFIEIKEPKEPKKSNTGDQP